ncbi:hypothetical protein PNEG_00294 [Pneumocystis murina B123]|uniref:Clathrin/coatomer adaptor adaptin-like N-terminal domain-containing protein n=1 Tax=Pneumocystis murina (strain B123) TaxID=1069680 RepID=M7PLF3_PNEMU|nr:hypothetical protein PNEG_00294 [Pneumocystis murina B123]EMR11264.1 hypothetical protein PNEG_00294 [Pneumocystis murina B123]
MSQEINFRNQSISTEINRLLNSGSEKDKLYGLKKVIYSMSYGMDMSEYFMSVVKNISSSNFEIQKLVYMYIIRYSEYDPNLSLLSINTIQRKLNDKNQIFRGTAIRMLSGIRVPAISKIILSEIKRCIMDMSFYVRKAAAISMVKCYRLDSSSLPILIEYLLILFNDQSHIVFGSALFVFQELCPEKLDLIHPYYRKICKVLHKLSEWDQVTALNILLVYARKCFLKPDDKTSYNSEDLNKKESFFNEESYFNEESNEKAEESINNILNKDLNLLLTSIIPLLRSRNSSVIMAACKILYHVGPLTKQSELAKPLIYLLKESSDIQYIVLTNIIAIAIKHPTFFSPFYKHFFIYPSDSQSIWELKFEILSLIARKENIKDILEELKWHTKSSNPNIIFKAIKSIGYCAVNHCSISELCLQNLIGNINSANDTLIVESIFIISQLIQLNPKDNLHYIEQLVLYYDSIKVASAKACIIYLMSKNIFNLPKLSLDMLRILAKSFSQQEEIVKSQILIFAVKLYIIYSSNCFEEKLEDSPLDIFLKNSKISNISDENNIPSSLILEKNKMPENEVIYNNPSNKLIVTKLYDYIMLLARYDLSYDLRDRARLYKFLALNSTSLFTQKVVFSFSPNIKMTTDSIGRETFTLGTLSLMLFKQIKGYENLPNWSDDITQLPHPNLREEKHNNIFEDTNDNFLKTSTSKKDKKDNSILLNINSVEILDLDDFYRSNTDTEDEDSETEIESKFNSNYEENTNSESTKKETSFENEEADNKQIIPLL